MKNKTLIGVAILLIGFLLGGVSFYLLGEYTGGQRIYMPVAPPRIPKKMLETGRAFSDIVRSVSPAVVNISSTKTVRRDVNPFFDDPFFDFLNPFRDFKTPRKWKEQSLGSGVIVSSDGFILTNNHVVEHADEVAVTLSDNRSFKARIIGTDPKTDVAVIKINGRGLPAVRWGDSDKLQVGEFVLAIGSPYGLNNTVTMGIISAVGRANVGIADYEDFIQTDAAINPGNSGGPLVNIEGEMIGINTAIFSRSGGYQGIGFAVPSNMAHLVMKQLEKTGKVTRGWLGVTIQELTPELSGKFGADNSSGALVGDVMKGSPAERAGIRRGDIITEYDGRKVKDVGSLRNMVAESPVGATVPVMVMRGGKEYRLKVRIAELPAEVAEAAPAEGRGEYSARGLPGLSVVELTGEIGKQLGLGKGERGVVVVKVEPGSSSGEAGLRKGDVIQEIDRKKVTGLERYNEIVSALSPGETVLLFINRGGKKFYAALRVS
ncbi:MAG: DegQ family serine endoprotease [Candidatus Sulfobium sp.]|jgi:serine protease Do